MEPRSYGGSRRVTSGTGDQIQRDKIKMGSQVVKLNEQAGGALLCDRENRGHRLGIHPNFLGSCPDFWCVHAEDSEETDLSILCL